MSSLQSYSLTDWEQAISPAIQNSAVQALESGKVLYFPHLPFILDRNEQRYLNPEIVNPKTKNISYDIHKKQLNGTIHHPDEMEQLKIMLHRYALYSRSFLEKLIPHYKTTLVQAKTSFRPVEISGRKSSYRKDDSLLHVDSFPSNPTKGKRILRFFTNINPNNQPRLWRVGEPFEDVVKKMAPKVTQPIPGSAYFLKTVGITKDYRTDYDHYMLKMHNLMKGDALYQQTVKQEEIAFPAGCSWIVFTDQVSHAAMSGQHVLEQTFHLPVNGLYDETKNPVRILEKYLNKSLI